MFRLLIVDDEYYVRVGIKSAIDWSEILMGMMMPDILKKRK